MADFNVNADQRKALVTGASQLVAIAGVPVILPVKFKAGDKMTEADAKVLQAAHVRQWRNNKEAENKASVAKGQPSMTSEAVAKGFETYAPGVGDDSLLHDAADRVLEGILNGQAMAGDERAKAVQNVLHSAKKATQDKLWAAVNEIVAEAATRQRGAAKTKVTADKLADQI